MKDRIGQEIYVGDFVIYVVQGNRNAGINFGWVEEIVDKTTQGVDYKGVTNIHYRHKVKINRAEPNGTRLNNIASHYRPENPQGQRFVEVDTGKPSIAWLDSHGENDHRLLVTKPL